MLASGGSIVQEPSSRRRIELKNKVFRENFAHLRPPSSRHFFFIIVYIRVASAMADTLYDQH